MNAHIADGLRSVPRVGQRRLRCMIDLHGCEDASPGASLQKKFPPPSQKTGYKSY